LVVPVFWGVVGFCSYFVGFAPPPQPPTPPFISQKPAKQRGKDTEYSFLREFGASSEFSSLPGGGGRPFERVSLKLSRSGAGGALRNMMCEG
jgi:hypothetical protein